MKAKPIKIHVTDGHYLLLFIYFYFCFCFILCCTCSWYYNFVCSIRIKGGTLQVTNSYTIGGHTEGGAIGGRYVYMYMHYSVM